MYKRSAPAKSSRPKHRLRSAASSSAPRSAYSPASESRSDHAWSFSAVGPSRTAASRRAVAARSTSSRSYSIVTYACSYASSAPFLDRILGTVLFLLRDKRTEPFPGIGRECQLYQERVFFLLNPHGASFWHCGEIPRRARGR